jgi:TusA-related sulfurtransferase
MILKTRQETLISLRNDQLEIVVNREASVRMLEEMAKEDPNKVLVVTPDMETLTPKAVTVAMRLKEMTTNLHLDQARLTTLEDMIAEEKSKGE